MAVWKDHSPYSRYIGRLPLQDSELVQLDPGKLVLSGIDVRGYDSFIVWFRTGPRAVWSQVPEAEWFGFLIPVSWSGEYLFNGRAATQNTIYRLDGAHEYHVVAEQRNALTVGVRRTALVRAVAGLSGGKDYALPDGHRAIEVPAGPRRRLLYVLRTMIAAASKSGFKGDFLKMPPVLENDLICALADWMIGIEEPETQHPTEHTSDLKIVRDAMDAMWQNRSLRLSLADLCRATGVKKSRLHRAFAEIHGISPGHYIYKHRLTRAREALLAADLHSNSVKNVAIQHGFLNSGQFAQAYRSMFDELPNQTLARDL